MNKPTVILDFDGVVHSYASGWKGAEVIPDPPTPGACEAIQRLREDYFVVIVSSRCHQPGGIGAIHCWLADHGIQVDDVTSEKPPHIVVVDDRAFRFEGDWDAVLAGIPAAAVPWNKRGPGHPALPYYPIPGVVAEYLQNVACEHIDREDMDDARDELWARMSPKEQDLANDLAQAIFGPWL